MSLILNGTTGVSDVDGTAATPAVRGSDTNTGIFFPAADTIAFAEGGAEVARFDASGNLGIGTSSPGSRLHVASAASATAVTVGNSSGTSEWQQNGNDLYISNYNASGAAIFRTNGTERARIDSSGNLLVGTTSNTENARLFVSYPYATSGGFAAIGTQTDTTLGVRQIAFRNPNGLVGSIQTSGSSTSYVTSSDYRLKENIQPMTGALARNALLNPVKYKWKADGSDGEGFVAHELQGPFPQAVTGEKDALDAEGKPVYQGIGTGPLDGHFAACINELMQLIQEQQAIIEQLKADVAALKGTL